MIFIFLQVEQQFLEAPSCKFILRLTDQPLIIYIQPCRQHLVCPIQDRRVQSHINKKTCQPNTELDYIQSYLQYQASLQTCQLIPGEDYIHTCLPNRRKDIADYTLHYHKPRPTVCHLHMRVCIMEFGFRSQIKLYSRLQIY